MTASDDTDAIFLATSNAMESRSALDRLQLAVGFGVGKAFVSLFPMGTAPENVIWAVMSTPYARFEGHPHLE